MTNDERATLYLSSLRRWITRLRWFSEAPNSDVDERERQAFPLEWDNALDRLIDVESMARHRDLGADTMRELRAVADELAAVIPMLRRHGLRLPDPEALARARSVTAA